MEIGSKSGERFHLTLNEILESIEIVEGKDTEESHTRIIRDNLVRVIYDLMLVVPIVNLEDVPIEIDYINVLAALIECEGLGILNLDAMRMIDNMLKDFGSGITAKFGVPARELRGLAPLDERTFRTNANGFPSLIELILGNPRDILNGFTKIIDCSRMREYVVDGSSLTCEIPIPLSVLGHLPNRLQ